MSVVQENLRRPEVRYLSACDKAWATYSPYRQILTVFLNTVASGFSHLELSMSPHRR